MNDVTASSVRTWEGPTRVRDLMTPEVATVGADETVAFALELMVWHAVRHLPVMQGSELVGVISDRDLIAHPATANETSIQQVRVEEVMSTELECAAPDEEASLASARMVAKRINSLLVVDDGKLVGILTSTDILAERGRFFLKQGKGEVPSAALVMTANPMRIRSTSPARHAVTILSKLGIRHLPVVDDVGRVVGMIEERNLRGMLERVADSAQRSDELTRQTAQDVMSTPPAVVAKDTSLFALASRFTQDRLGAVVVVDQDDRLEGIISYVDVLRYLMG